MNRGFYRVCGKGFENEAMRVWLRVRESRKRGKRGNFGSERCGGKRKEKEKTHTCENFTLALLLLCYHTFTPVFTS